MSKIVSRVSEESEHHKRLLTIVDALWDDLVTDERPKDSNTLDGAITMVDILVLALLLNIEDLDDARYKLQLDNINLKLQLREAERQIDVLNEKIKVVKNPQYDSDLDFVTTDFMQVMIACGAGVPTFDGALAFEDETVFTKDDLKPYIKDILSQWIELKLPK